MSLDIAPDSRIPSPKRIEAAADDLPDVLIGMKSTRWFTSNEPDSQQRLVLASNLVDELEKKGHLRAASEHAIHLLNSTGLLTAEVAIVPARERERVIAPPDFLKQVHAAIDGNYDARKYETEFAASPARPRHSGKGRVAFDSFLIRSTDELWEANQKGTVANKVVSIPRAKQIPGKQSKRPGNRPLAESKDERRRKKANLYAVIQKEKKVGEGDKALADRLRLNADYVHLAKEAEIETITMSIVKAALQAARRKPSN